MAEERSKTLLYLRAKFASDEAKSLGHYLNAAHKKTPNIEQRKFIIDDQEVTGCHFRRIKNGKHYLHIAVSTPGESTSLVPKSTGVKEVDLETFPPPEGKDFMDGDLMLLVDGNHVLFCSTGAHIKKARQYMKAIFDHTSQPDESMVFDLAKVADVDKINLIRESGVKSLRLGAGLYKATLDHEERRVASVRKKVLTAVWSEVEDLFADDEELKKYKDEENLTAEVIIKFDRRLKGGKYGKQRMEALAEKVLDGDDDEGFKIETFGGETISSAAITLRKQVQIVKKGKSVAYNNTWRAMNEYLAELRTNGLLDQ
jgi:hypothetical protein